LQNNVSDSVDILGLIDITNIPGIMTANQWTHGAALMKHWFDSTGKNDTTTVTMDWVLGYARARDVYDNIINEKVYVNDAAKQQIIALAKKKGVYKKGGSFGSTSGDVETLDKDYIQYRAVGSILDPIDDLNTALGTFVFRIIVEGSVKGRGYHHCFTISKIGIYVRDSYDFKGDQFLGFWNDKTNYGGRNWFKGESVSNKDFRDYTAKTGKGKDFIVFSNINSIGFKVSEFFEEQGK